MILIKLKINEPVRQQSAVSEVVLAQPVVLQDQDILWVYHGLTNGHRRRILQYHHPSSPLVVIPKFCSCQAYLNNAKSKLPHTEVFLNSISTAPHFPQYL